MDHSALFSSRRKLSARLQAIYEQMQVGQDVWDFCCDHGYLGLSAYQSGNYKQIHFVDQAKHLIARLRAKYQLQSDELFFWDCSGQEISVPVRGNVVIAGVGATTALQILSGLLQSSQLQALRILVSPHKDESDFRWLQLEAKFSKFTALYELKTELEIPDGKRSRPLFVFERRLIG